MTVKMQYNREAEMPSPRYSINPEDLTREDYDMLAKQFHKRRLNMDDDLYYDLLLEQQEGQG